MALRISAPKRLAVLLLATLLGSCSDDLPPNVVLITLDTTRADHLSCYGYERQTSPVLDAFAAEGAKFELAFAPIATTGPSHSTMFTALYPLAHHVIKNGIPLADDQVTLAELLKSSGYQTAAIVSSFVLTERFGFAQGFEFFDDEFTVEHASVKGSSWEDHTYEGGFDRRANETTRRAIAWIEQTRRAERPFFLFVHYFDPHSPYSPPPEFRNHFGSTDRKGLDKLIALYDEEIAFTDREIGLLLDSLSELQLSDETIVVVTADHGEGLGDHKHLEHGINIFDEAVRVPLLIRWPEKIQAGQQFEQPVEFVDLLPTLLDLTETGSIGARSQGRSLASALLGQASLASDRPVFLHRRHYEPRIERKVRIAGQKFGVRRDNWKLILGPEENTAELYDLNSDPSEENNRYEAEPEKVRELTALLDEWHERMKSDKAVELELSDEDRAGLEALGYTE